MNSSSLNQLEEMAKEEWAKIPVDVCKKLVHSSSRCLQAVLANDGFSTKY